MASLLTPTIIAREALRLLKNNLVMGSSVYRAYEAEFPGTPKKGGSVTIRKPVKFSVTKARTRTSSVITEQSTTITVATQAHVSWAFYMHELTLTIEEYSTRYIAPAAAALANQVDADLCALYKDVYNTVYESSGFVTPHTFMAIGQALQRLDEEAAPPEDKTIVLNPAANWAIANALAGMYLQEPGTTALRKGRLGRIGGAEIFMDQNIKTHTTGVWGGSGVTAATDATGKIVGTGAPTGATNASGTGALNICNFDIIHSQVLKAGDIFTIAGVYAVNCMSGQSTGVLRQFVVTAEASCGSTGTTTEVAVSVSVAPNLIQTGPYKTIDTYPAGGAVVDPLGLANHQYPQNLVFHKNAFALCFVPLEKPDGVAFADTVTEDGYSISIVKTFDIDAYADIIRLDILYGVKTIYPELAVRLAGCEAGT